MSRSREHDVPLLAAAGRRAALGQAGLAERMRPACLDDIVGQEAVVRVLRDGLAGGRTGSLLLWGPPGTGKTTLARLLASMLYRYFSLKYASSQERRQNETSKSDT
jgi:putative ATPase